MLLLAGAAAAAPRHTAVLRLPGRMWGVIPAGHDAAGRPARPQPSQFAAGHGPLVNNLLYHGGPVMHTNTTYTILWGPTTGFASGYGGLINQFLGDVGAESRSAGNVYAADTQYYDTFAPVSYVSSLSSTWNDTSTPIPNNCSGEYARTGVTVSGCVLDSDIQAEVARAIAKNGWPDGLGAEYFVLTPDNVGSCFDSSSGQCSYTYYCAYHSDYIDAGGNPVLYANMPYTNTSGVGAPGACDVGQHPNNNQADATINVLSHEHNETITDPLGTAWWDSAGNENGDKCAWNFGSVLGSTTSGEFNQVIDDHYYWLQQEWSNASSGCVQHYGALSTPAISGFSGSSGTVGAHVTISGSNLNDAYAVSFHGVAATFTDAAGTISATVPAGASTGPISVTTVGGTATSAASFTVLPTGNQDFSLSASAGVTVARGATATYTITVNDLGGFAGPVSLIASGVPSRAAASFSPNPTATTSTLTVRTNRHSPTGTFTLTITGTSGSLRHTVQVTLKLT